MEEEWRKINGYPGYYVSNLGNVKRSVKGGGEIPVTIYRQVRKSSKTVLKICINMGKYVQQLCVHRLVAEAFCSGSGKYVFHKDGNPENNCSDNLYFSDKMQYAVTNDSKRRPVIQYSLAGVVVKRHNSITDASKQSGVYIGGICACCSGKIKTSGGYKWEYAEPDKQ